MPTPSPSPVRRRARRTAAVAPAARDAAARRGDSARATRAALPPAPWARALLRWYRQHHRPLPWRATRDPYRIWVSEVMLQQTQVAAATPYYAEFVRRFPSLRALAAAPVDDVLHAWAGLGYYRRARHLHEAARAVVRDHGGRIPPEAAAFGRLPGVGRYTMGAVLSIGFGRPLPVLDGNVARVLSRLEAIPAAVKEPRGARLLWERATALVPLREPGTWNQALMELGATVCTPRAPACGRCAVARWCAAFAAGRVDEFPPVPARRPTVAMRRAVVLVRRANRVLLVRREGALLAGLWEPPGVELRDGEPAGPALTRELRRLGVRASLADTGRVVRHTITHRRIAVEVWTGEARAGAGCARGAMALAKWVDAGRPAVALTALGRRVVPPSPQTPPSSGR